MNEAATATTTADGTQAATADDAAAANGTATTTTTDDGTATEPKTVEALEAELEKWKSQSRKHEERSKANADAAKELERVKRESMSETEKAVAQARDEGRAEARAEVGRKLVAAELRAVAAGRLDDDALAAAVEHLDLASFLDDDGDVDAKKVVGFMDGIAPKQDENGEQPTRQRTRDLGQGARGGSSMALNGDPLTRALASAVGAPRT